MKRPMLFVVGLAVLLLSDSCLASWAKEFRLERWELRTGYGYQYTNSKSRPNNYQVVQLVPSFTLPLTDEMGPAWLRGRFLLSPELMLNTFIHPYDRPMLGITPLQVQFEFKSKGRLLPYVNGGLGVLWANVERKETGADINFNSQVGVGARWLITEDLGLILEYRHIHLSNAGIDEKNSGINTHNFLLGLSVRK
ncbi:MAG: acyloxyacyl hydrolase [Candidatus Omnitrophica bacterium]|nr:acyloxyacyl hydrolase [Candidatus Omnitrophota bacterium]